KPEKKIVDCFAEYMLSLVGRFGIAMFNPYDPEFMNGAVPVMHSIISQHKDIKKTLADSESRLTDAGYHIQVRKASTAAHLFFHDPARTAIHYEGGKFKAAEKSFSENELVAAIADRPLDFSPDVLTRPLIQSYVFPTVAVIGGPAEVAYYAQLMSLFEILKIVPPQVIARPTVTIVEKRFERLMDRHGIKFEDIIGDIEPVISRALRDSLPNELDKRIAELSSTT
ncbi:unnamed protein product, partial [marine sediment metagenome]